MRDQFQTKRLGLVLGAGINAPLGFPDWDKLIKRIASDPEVNGEGIRIAHAKSGLPYQTEMLFQHFRKNRRQREKKTLSEREFDFDTHAHWRKILSKHLYKGTQAIRKGTIKDHPYLEPLLKIVRQLQVTVTYNFDDVLERALHETRSGAQADSSRGYVVITNGALQLHGRGPAIYHPNGLIPKKSQQMETPSDRLIFSEHSYADLLVDLLSGDHSRLMTYLTDHTSLFVGVSLSDQGVRNLLRQCAKTNPGNYHYLVSWLRPKERDDPERRTAAEQTNFRIYNLRTLFLTDTEIAALARLISMNEDEFCDLAESNDVKTKYCFYLTGPLGVGKSTAISSLGSLNTFDEWMEPRPPILAKPWTELTPKERETADKWILRQFRLKNDNVRKKRAGLYVLDRGPLDPLAFTRPADWRKKALLLRAAISPGASRWRVESGCVVLLEGDYKELSLRLRLTERNRYTARLLAQMQRQLEQAYVRSNCVCVDTKGLTPSAAVNQIAHLIHMDEYKEMDLHERLKYLAKRKTR
jgi:hypothetical protein